LLSRSGLVSVTGGKWTTYRSMAQDVLQTCARHHLIAPLPPADTAHLQLIGAPVATQEVVSLCRPPGMHSYGSEAQAVRELPGSDTELCPGLTEGMVRFAARFEYAVQVEDVLARRSRLLFLDAQLARALATRVGEILLEETGIDPAVAAFEELAQTYLTLP
jgi:glycerol-3-phosphate dehydrogenase